MELKDDVQAVRTIVRGADRKLVDRIRWKGPNDGYDDAEAAHQELEDAYDLGSSAFFEGTVGVLLMEEGQVYWVTAINDQGQESLPCPPLVAAVLAVGIPCRFLKEGDERVADMAFRNTERTASPPWRPGSS